jgi:integrase
LSPEMGLALQFAAVALRRGREVVGARKDEFDMPAKTWLIPRSRMKGKRPHLVPLSPLAIDILSQASALSGDSEFVFPSPRGAGADVPMDRGAFIRAMSRVCAELEIENATPHDFRRTGATCITSERIGIARFIVSQVLAHSTDTGGAAAVTGTHYDLNDYLPDKRRALDAWAALLGKIVLGRS